MTRSRITSRGRITLPLPVHAALGLRPGNDIAYGIKEGRVEIAAENPIWTFAEWESDADHRAYAGW